MRSFLQQRTLALLQHVLFRDDIILLEDFASLFNEGHVKQKPGWEQRVCGCEKQQNFSLKSSKLQFSSLCFWWFFPNFCEPKTLSHILYPPTHAHTHALSLSHTHTHTHTHTPLHTPVISFPHGETQREHTCPVAPLKFSAVQSGSSQTAFRLLTSCLYSIYIYPPIFPSIFQSTHPSSVFLFLRSLFSRFVRCWHESFSWE